MDESRQRLVTLAMLGAQIRTEGQPMSHTPLMVDCGCKTMTHNPVIKYCPLHAAAPTMLEALRAIQTYWASRKDHEPIYISLEIMGMVSEALAHAEQKS